MKKIKSLIHLVSILFLIVCLPLTVQAAELDVQTEAEISGGGVQSPELDSLSEDEIGSAGEEIFSSAPKEVFTDGPDEEIEDREQYNEMLLRDNTDEVWVNNVNLLAVPNNEIQCGDGTATYDVNTGTLTLKDATINIHNDVYVTSVYYYSFVWLNTQKDCTIILEGENHIGKTGDLSQGAIMAECNLTIKGPGSLNIEAGGTSWDKQFQGIHTIDTNITIEDTVITMTNQAVGEQGGINNFRGVFAQSGGKVTISNTILNIAEYRTGIGNGGADIEIKNGSKINMTVQEPGFQSKFGINGANITISQSDIKFDFPNNQDGFSAIGGNNSVTLDGAVIKAVFDDDNQEDCIWSFGDIIIKNGCDINAKSAYCSVYGEKNVSINDSKIQAVSARDSAIFSKGTLTINGASDISAEGNLYGLISRGDININSGKVNAVGLNAMGIFSNGMLNINGGEIHAKGGAGYAAISARSVQTAPGEAQLRINADSMAEINNAQAACSAWFQTSGGNQSWSSFIPLQDKELEVQNGVMQNALDEVWLKPAYTVTFDVNGGSGANTIAKVYPGNLVQPPTPDPSRPGYYLTGWLAEDGSYFDFASTSIDENRTLKANWAPNVYYYNIQASAGEHGTITPSGNISVREYTDQAFTFTPDEGYETAEVLVDGKKVQTADSYKFESVTASHTISVAFLKKVPESYPDGTVAKPDGSFETPGGIIILPDGTVILNDKDKTEMKPDSEGNAAVVNKDGTVTLPDGSVRNPDGIYVRPAKPIIDRAEVKGNRVNIYLKETTAGAEGYDYVISPNPNCIIDKDYTRVNKNVLLTDTSMFYIQQDTYYAYCHSWFRGSDGKKVFSQWSEGYEFTVTDYTPDTPSIVKVTNPKKGVVIVTVSVPKGAKGFDVILGRSVKKVNGEKRPVDYGADVRKNRKSTLKTVTFRNVKPGRVYAALHSYSRSQVKNEKVFSKWSMYKSIKVK